MRPCCNNANSFHLDGRRLLRQRQLGDWGFAILEKRFGGSQADATCEWFLDRHRTEFKGKAYNTNKENA
eukprot:4018759-Amphidinium_carterae.1